MPRDKPYYLPPSVSFPTELQVRRFGNGFGVAFIGVEQTAGKRWLAWLVRFHSEDLDGYCPCSVPGVPHASWPLDEGLLTYYCVKVSELAPVEELLPDEVDIPF